MKERYAILYSDSYDLDENNINNLNDIVDKIYQQNIYKGWHPNNETDKDVYRVATKIALIHSELSEALEGYRRDLMDDHLPHRKMIEVELADAVIRIFDLVGRLDLDLSGAIAEKHTYNRTREDHKKENREKEHGKKF